MTGLPAASTARSGTKYGFSVDTALAKKVLVSVLPVSPSSLTSRAWYAPALEFHIWGSTVEDLDRPERLVFDLDPDPAVSFPDVRKAAVEMRDFLAEIGLVTFPMLTGGKGVHVIAPLAPAADWSAAKAFARQLAETMAAHAPDRYVANMAKAKRKGRIFIDYLRNERGSTAIAPFSTRARDARTGRNPRTGETVDVCAKRVPYFKPGKEMRARLNVEG